MKLHKIFKTLGVIAILFVLLAVPTFMVSAAGLAQKEAPTLNEGHFYVIGIVASALVYVFKQLASKGVTLKREHLSIGLYVIAGILTLYFGGISFPVFGEFSDPPSFIAALFGFIDALLVALGPSVAFATLIYNVLLKRVLDAGMEKLTAAAG